jgi:hypothetical protein
VPLPQPVNGIAASATAADKKAKPTRSGRLSTDWILPPARRDHKLASAMLLVFSHR